MKIATGFLMAAFSMFLVYGFFEFGVPLTLWYALFFLLAWLIIFSATASFWLALATFIKKGGGRLGFVPDLSKISLVKCFGTFCLSVFWMLLFIPAIVSCYLEIVQSSYSLSQEDMRKIGNLLFGAYWLPYLSAYITSVGLAGFAMAVNAFPEKEEKNSRKPIGPPGSCRLD